MSEKNKQELHEILIEEYVFGHKGGMGPIAWSESISEEDQGLCCSMIEIFQGPNSWQEDKWALSWCYFPSGKVGVTAVFPDNDVTGRSTVFGHTLLLTLADFKKIKCNPFVLMDLGCFEKKRDIPEAIPTRKIIISSGSVTEACQEPLQGMSAGFESVLQLALQALQPKRVYVGTRVPANKLLRTIVCCLPPAARSLFTFSTMEIDPTAHELERHKGRSSQRNILFSAVPVESARAFRQGNNTVVVELDGLASNSSHEKLSQDSAYVATIMELLEKGQNLGFLFDRVDETLGSNLTQHEYAIALKLISDPDGVVISDDNFRSLWVMLMENGKNPEMFFQLCLKAIGRQQSPAEWETAHNWIEKCFQRMDVAKCWPDLRSVYEKLIQENQRLAKILLDKVVRFPEHCQRDFVHTLMPIVVGQVRQEINSPDAKWEKLKPLIERLLDKRWLNYRAFTPLIIELFNSILKREWNEAAKQFIRATSQTISVNDFATFLQGILSAAAKLSPNKAGQVVLEFAKHIAIDESLLIQNRFQKLYIICSEHGNLLSRQHAGKIGCKLLEAAIASKKEDNLYKTIQILSKEAFSAHRGRMIELLIESSTRKFEIAQHVLNSFGFDESFQIARIEKIRSKSDFTDFISYLDGVMRVHSSSDAVISQEFKDWVNSLNLNRYSKHIPDSGMALLQDFGVHLKPRFSMTKLWKLLFQRVGNRFLDLIIIVLFIVAILLGLLVWQTHSPNSFPFRTLFLKGDDHIKKIDQFEQANSDSRESIEEHTSDIPKLERTFLDANPGPVTVRHTEDDTARAKNLTTSQEPNKTSKNPRAVQVDGRR